mgnify:FL=1
MHVSTLWCHPYIYLSHYCVPLLHSFTTHISFLPDARYIGMTMLLVPLSVLAAICLHPRTSVLGVIKVPLDNVIRMWVDGGTQRCRACCKPITLAGVNKNRNFMEHVLKHVSLTVCGICYLTGCSEHVIRHCRNFHRQKTTCVPHAYMGRFVIHPDLLEPFIKFSRGRGLTDQQEASVRNAFADKKFLLPSQPRMMMV